MKSFPVGLAVSVTLRFEDFNGDPVTPTGLSYHVEDENGSVVRAAETISVDPTATEVAVVIPAAINFLPAGTVSGARTVILSITTTEGVHEVSEIYTLRRPQRLSVLENSFITYAKAVVVADDMPRLDSWNLASAPERQQALIEAFTRLTRLGYHVKYPEGVEGMSYLNDRILFDRTRISPQMWSEMTTEWFGGLPKPFLEALAKAQVAEANELLSGDVVGAKRRLGLMSESIGESSMMFRPGKPLDLGVSRAALDYLTGYVDLRMTATRS